MGASRAGTAPGSAHALRRARTSLRHVSALPRQSRHPCQCVVVQLVTSALAIRELLTDLTDFLRAHRPTPALLLGAHANQISLRYQEPVGLLELVHGLLYLGPGRVALGFTQIRHEL